MIYSSDLDSPILWVFKFFTYFVGVYLHLRVIYVSIREKGLTWKLDTTNSSISIVHFSHVLFLYGITYLVEDLSLYTGDWYCYLAKEVRFYGALYITGHSLIVSVMKYILIVYWDKARVFGKTKVKEIFFWLDFIHPLMTIGICIMITPEFIWVWDMYKEIDLCLGDPENHWIPQSNASQTKAHDLCLNLLETEPESHLEYIIWVTRIIICWIQIVALYLISWNFGEMITYCRIFTFMRKQIENPPNKRRKSNAEEIELDEADKFQQSINLKRMQVNAQITATTTILEFLGHFTYIIHLKLAKGSNLANSIHFEAVYAILIPYALLMNTSDNKDRIIEAGWKNIFRNILGIKSNSAVEPGPDGDLKGASKKNIQENDASIIKSAPSDTNAAINPPSNRNNAISSTIDDDVEINLNVPSSNHQENK